MGRWGGAGFKNLRKKDFFLYNATATWDGDGDGWGVCECVWWGMGGLHHTVHKDACGTCT